MSALAGRSAPLVALLWFSRLALGAVFLVAAWPKITDVPAFAANIHNYRMLPIGLVPAFAALLAGVEVAVGLSLVAGIWRKGSAILVTGMLVMFLVALTTAYLEGRSIHCGCFTADLDPAKVADLRAEMRWRIVQDLGLLALALHLAWDSLRRPPAPA